MGKPPRLAEGNDRTTYQDGWAPLFKKHSWKSLFFRGEKNGPKQGNCTFILGHIVAAITQLLRRGSSCLNLFELFGKTTCFCWLVFCLLELIGMAGASFCAVRGGPGHQF